jgi:CRISPR system Cascade subunit CasA
MTQQTSLLTAACFALKGHAGLQQHTLPGVLAALAIDDVRSFDALQAHQQHAWHAFTVQLATIVLHRHGERRPPTDEGRWRDLLEGLTEGDHAPWSLVVPELSRPAFLQPPIPEGSLAGWKRAGSSPDEIDLLVTAKCHDVKSRRIDASTPEHWVYALVSLQTMQGFLGAGNYGIARMNGGFSNRPGIGFSDGLSLGKRFVDDVSALLTERNHIIESFHFTDDEKPALLWLLPWDGKSAPLKLEDCDPYFIEVCRRIRLRETQDRRIEALGTPTKVARFVKSTGLTGDPWTPTGEDAALTVNASGFDYGRLSELLFESKRFRPGAAMRNPHRRKSPHLLAQALVRGQGKTEGLHQRVLPLRPGIEEQLDDPEAKAQLAIASRARIDAVTKVRKNALKPALCALLQGAPPLERLDYRDDRPQRWLDAFEADVDRIFFEDFFATYHSPKDDGLDAWKRRLRTLAHTQLQAAVRGGPVPVQRRWAAEAMAESLFQSAIRRHLELSPKSEDDRDEPTAA